MAGGSHLKRLKASLRDQGITGQKQSKKGKQDRQSGQVDKRLQRKEALTAIRDEFNPFDLKKSARGPKFPVTSINNATKSILGRPTAAKSMGEERRRQTLLTDMQRRNRVGGILDRRFGESDPTMAEEDKMLERFAREKQRTHKKTNLFDLEEMEPLSELTHMGQSLTFDEDPVDDFDETDLQDDDSQASDAERRQLKRRLREAGMDDGSDGESEEDEPQRKKTKKEVMQEVISKSKFHKYERQAAKDEDEELRRELDKDLPDLQMLLAGRPRKELTAEGGNDAARARQKEFDMRLKMLVQDRRSRPVDRTKTEEEVAKEEQEKLKSLEEERVKRMRGESVSDDDDESKQESEEDDVENAEEPAWQFIPVEGPDEDFGLGKGIKSRPSNRPSAVELGGDEDDFELDDSLIASGSDLEPLSDESGDEDSEDDQENGQDGDQGEEEDEFIKGLLKGEEEAIFKAPKSQPTDGELPYSFPCPESLEELIALFQRHPVDQAPTIVQRIRALYHPRLDSKHKPMLAKFAKALVGYIGTDHEGMVSYQGLEMITRHIHSLAKSFPIEISQAYRDQLEEIRAQRPLALHTGDLTLFTALGTQYPTSDHFHQVITPAILTAARYLGQSIPKTLGDYAKGLYLSTLSVQWQKHSKRFLPEAISYLLKVLASLSPVVTDFTPGNFPFHEPVPGIRITDAKKCEVAKLSLRHCAQGEQEDDAEKTKVALVSTAIQVLEAAAQTWAELPAVTETMQPALRIAKHLTSKACRSKLPGELVKQVQSTTERLTILLNSRRLARRPLLEHHHRPLAIKTAVPKFEDTFDPNKHYDPDRERAEIAKLRAEHKKERKSALREIRKDARFMAQETLRVKKARDEAYEKKYKRLMAEIQNEAGKEANEYEREKEARKKARGR